MINIVGRTATGIADALEQAIARGQWGPGGSLPTVRGLAERLGVAPATVSGAYRILRDRGLTVGNGRRGTRVRHLPQVLGTAASRGGGSAATVAVLRPSVDLASGQPDPALLGSLNAAVRALTQAPVGYPSNDVLPALASFAKSEFSADGIPPGPIAATSGALDAIERALRERLRPGDRVAIEDPVLPALIQLIAASGYRAIPVSVDASGPVPASLSAALAERPAALVVTPRAQNPTGAALTEGRAGELKRALRDHPDLLLIENDPAAAIAGVPAVTLVDRRRRAWMVIRSLSKALGPDLRVAVATGDAVTMTRVRTRQALGVRWVSHLLQYVALAMWSDPAAGRHLARAAGIYATRRRALTDALASHGIETMAGSGFNVWVPVPEETAACRALDEAGWQVATGEPFRLRSGPAVRITTSALAPEDAPRLAGCVAEVRRRPPAQPV